MAEEKVKEIKVEETKKAETKAEEKKPEVKKETKPAEPKKEEKKEEKKPEPKKEEKKYEVKKEEKKPEVKKEKYVSGQVLFIDIPKFHRVLGDFGYPYKGNVEIIDVIDDHLRVKYILPGFGEAMGFICKADLN